jgi:hypothetical protein
LWNFFQIFYYFFLKHLKSGFENVIFFRFVSFLKCFFSIRFVSQIFSFLYLFCFKPLRNNLYFSFPLSTFIYSDNTALDTKIIFRCCNFYFLEETRRDGKSKIHLISLQKDNVRQQNPSNSCAERRKDALHNRKEPFDAHSGCRNGEKNVWITWQSPLVFIVKSQLTDTHVLTMPNIRLNVVIKMRWLRQCGRQRSLAIRSKFWWCTVLPILSDQPSVCTYI